MANNAPVEMPWFTICSAPPCKPRWFSANNPSMQKPIWLTLEYAIKRLISLCASATNAPYKIPITASHNSQGMAIAAASGSIGMLKRKNP